MAPGVQRLIAVIKAMLSAAKSSQRFRIMRIIKAPPVVAINAVLDVSGVGPSAGDDEFTGGAV
ncbi:hypothetical protein [uncultured Thiocystis sp.]|jgi:hypothetical protein|uniref:hypothetical protein n=1 Tax=uncultured Thiocystis sp. TaxID=1202134 RepID=UPI0025F30EBF|nr:hypothetical protein [uncultured Thiocystis sp.]